MKKIILEPVWNYKYDKGTLDERVDYKIIGIRHIIRAAKEKMTDYKYRHLKLGRVVYDGKPFENHSFKIDGISWGINWQVDRYLAIIIRDYLRFHIKESPAIGNCILRDNPEGIPYEDFLFDKVNNEVDYHKRWEELVLSVADEFDDIRLTMESDHKEDKEFYDMYQIKINKAFKDLAYIYQDLGW